MGSPNRLLQSISNWCCFPLVFPFLVPKISLTFAIVFHVKHDYHVTIWVEKWTTKSTFSWWTTIPDKLLSYQAILDELGENLIQAHSGSEALEHLLKNDIAIVLMDVSMPELDGFELAKMIHQHPRFQNNSIIFVSGIRLTDLDRLKGYEHGAVDYISVPVVPDLLKAKVRVFAELYRKSRQLEMLNESIIRLR